MKARNLINKLSEAVIDIPGYGEQPNEGEFNQPSIKFILTTSISDYEMPVKYSLLMDGFTPAEVNQITIEGVYMDSGYENADYVVSIHGPEALMKRVSKHFAEDIDRYSSLSDLDNEDDQP